jgi:nodulation protein E
VQPQRVAVTGIGAVSALGLDAPSTWEGLAAGRVGIAPLRDWPCERPAHPLGAAVTGFDAAGVLGKTRLPLLDRCAQFALAAAAEAVRQAAGGRDVAALDVDPRRAGVVFAAGLGHHTLEDAYRGFYGDGSPRVHPLVVPRAMPSAPASWLAMAHGLQGPAWAVASACASGTHAIGQAFQMVRSGGADLMLCGGAEASLTPGYLAAWEALRVLSPDGCRPFAADRNGLVLGEGAAVLVLESFGRARARGATILAEVLGTGCSADAGDITAPDARGAAQAMQSALRDAELPASAVDHVNAHGTGTRLNDRCEADALAAVFGPRLRDVPVSSSKSMLGHCLNAGGALEALACVMALRHGLVPPTAGCTRLDPDIHLDVVPLVARPAALGVVQSNSFAFGGLNGVLLFGHPERA